MEVEQENIYNWMIKKTFNDDFLNKKLYDYSKKKKEIDEKLNNIKTKINNLLIAKSNLNDIEQLKIDYKVGQKLSNEIVNKIINKIIITEEKEFKKSLNGVDIFNHNNGDKVLQIKIQTENDTELIFYISQRTNFILMKTVSGFLQMEDFFDGVYPREAYDFITKDYEDMMNFISNMKPDEEMTT